MSAQPLRCAIYTRKSSDEGLEQSFNSLHAQREACEAYIKSQAHEGWRLVKTAFDDGGFSGGNMERPGLKALLQAIDQGEIDALVVYKVDRLTRSLSDFSRIIERLDQRKVSFVSITQAFNTTTSMGRLTLNVLLSFAQFEREVTGERIRDKIAQSKAKGMWMGGGVPLGYDSVEKKLMPNPGEAERVRRIFQLYLELGNVRRLSAALIAEGAISKRNVTAKGRVTGGLPFTRGQLYHLLRNPVYVGKVRHKDKTYPGLQAAIVDAEVFEAVQGRLDGQRHARKDRPLRSSGSPLKGLIFDLHGSPMSPTFAQSKSGRAYRYYVSSPLQRGEDAPAGLCRISASTFEQLVLEQLRRVLGRPAVGWDEARPNLARVDLYPACAILTLAGVDRMSCDIEDLHRRLVPNTLIEFAPAGELRLSFPIRTILRGGRTWICDANGRSAVPRKSGDLTLAKTLHLAHRRARDLGYRPLHIDENDIKPAPDTYTRRLIRLAFLAPDIQSSILAGTAPAGLSWRELLVRDIPISWARQRLALGFAA